MLSKDLKQIRISRGLTQEEIADQVFVSRTTYNKWEKGKTEIPISKFKSLIKELELTNSEVIKLLSPETMTEQETVIKESYEKVIGYYKTALRFAFDQAYSENFVAASGTIIPFEDLPEGRKKLISDMLGYELTEQDYYDYYADMYRTFSDEDLYEAFKHTLQDNPGFEVLFQFGLFEEEHEDCWVRFQNEHELLYNFFFDNGYEDWSANFIKTIKSINKGFDFSFSPNAKRRWPELFSNNKG